MAFCWRLDPILLPERTEREQARSDDPETVKRLGLALAQGGRDSMNARWRGHLAAIDATGIGLYYGDASGFQRMTAPQRREWIARNQKAGATPRTPRASSCIGWAMEHVKAAYMAAGLPDRWGEIGKVVAASRTTGGPCLLRNCRRTVGRPSTSTRTPAIRGMGTSITPAPQQLWRAGRRTMESAWIIRWSTTAGRRPGIPATSQG